jgi:hypothetical protein
MNVIFDDIYNKEYSPENDSPCQEFGLLERQETEFGNDINNNLNNRLTTNKNTTFTTKKYILN